MGGLSFGDPSVLEEAFAHVFNFRGFDGDAIAYPSGWIRRGRVILTGGGWEVTLDSVDDVEDLIDALNAKGGYAITQVARIRRLDGAAFRAVDVDDCLSVLGYLLSFARGAWTFPGLIVASGAGDPERWRVWNDPRVRSWASVMGWFDHDDPATLATAFERLWPVWLDTARRPVLQTGLALLMDAFTDVNVESRIVLAQAGLERLAWQRLVKEKRWSASKFNDKSTTAAMKIRELLKVGGISPALPAKLAPLLSTPGLGTPPDGPAFAVAVRNRTVHPPKSGPPFFPTEVVTGAWQLSLEYVQLSLLAFLGYTGSVLSPVTFKPHSFP